MDSNSFFVKRLVQRVVIYVYIYIYICVHIYIYIVCFQEGQLHLLEVRLDTMQELTSAQNPKKATNSALAVAGSALCWEEVNKPKESHLEVPRAAPRRHPNKKLI